MEDHTQRNLDDLRRAAQLQLEAQQKAQQQEEQEEDNINSDDPYAALKADLDEDDNEPAYSVPTPSENLDNNPDLNIKTLVDDDIAIPEINYGEEAIFPGGPTQSMVDVWKAQFKNSTVLHTKILERHFIFRTLNRYEYKQIIAISNIDAITREEVICKTCILWPVNYNFKAMAKDDSGYPGTLAQIIMESSGFTSEYGIEVL